MDKTIKRMEMLDKVEGKKYSTYKLIKKLIKEERRRK